MTTGLLVILIAGACLSGWALLSVLATERHRLISEVEAKRPRLPAPAAPTPLKPIAAKAANKTRPAANPSAGAKQSKAKTPPAAANAR